MSIRNFGILTKSGTNLDKNFSDFGKKVAISPFICLKLGIIRLSISFMPEIMNKKIINTFVFFFRLVYLNKMYLSIEHTQHL